MIRNVRLVSRYFTTSRANIAAKSSSIVHNRAATLGHICFNTTTANSKTSANINHVIPKTITTNGPSLFKLQYKLINLAKSGELDGALKLLNYMIKSNYHINLNIYCSLLKYATEYQHESVFSTILSYIKDYNVSHDVQLYTAIVSGTLTFYGYDEAMKVYDLMINEGFSLRKDLLNVLFKNRLANGDIKNSIMYFEVYLEQSTLPPVHLIKQFITFCLDKELPEGVMKLLQHYSSLHVPVEEDLVHHFKEYYDEYNNRYGHCWNTSLTTIERSTCASCQSRLPSNRLSEDEVNKLNHHITDLISKKVGSLPSGKYDLKEMERLKEMVSAHSPFEYVMDAANVGHTGETSFSFNKVLEMCKRLMEKKDCKLLVIGHQFMHTHFINVNGKPVTEQEAVDYYAKQGVYFFFKHYRIPDDYCVMYATLNSSNKTMFITNDRFLDHIVTMELKGEMEILFRQWQSSQQIKLKYDDDDDDGNIRLIYPRHYETKVHIEDDGCCHIPIQQSQQWLCVRKSEHKPNYIL